MKLMFLTFSPLASNAGHLARLKLELDYLSKINKIAIVCLGKNCDDTQTRKRYKNITFFHVPIKFNGWSIADIGNVVENVNEIVEKVSPELVVLQMEIWDLIRELGKKLKDKTFFTVVVHAMPFLVAPLNPTSNFEKDVIQSISSSTEPYRKEYILKHYLEAPKILLEIPIIANNKTVSFYLRRYFKNIHMWTLVPSIVARVEKKLILAKNPTYDFAYMARMEFGKGIEYLSEILINIAKKMGRKIKIAILGRADDSKSQEELNKLLLESNKSSFFSAEYFGWANDNLKKKVLLNTGAFLYPSHYDNYPTVFNEALAFGLPCVTWDVPFYRINYLPTKAVKSAPLFDFEMFANESILALRDRSELSKKALEFARSFYGPKKIAEMDTVTFGEIIKNEHN